MDVSITAPTRKSLARQITWFGGNRMVVGASGLLMAVVGMTMIRGFGLLYGISIALPVGLWFVLVWIARLMNKADPLMVEVMLRQNNYREVYAPKADLGVEHRNIKDFR